LVACLSVSCCLSTLQGTPWQPAPEYNQIPIWPNAVPDARPAAAPETFSAKPTSDPNRFWTCVENVTVPTITVYPPKGKNTGVAIVVFPGGGYNILSIDTEGTAVCEWLASKGITGILLKYRVPASGPHWNSVTRKEEDAPVPAALEDAQRAVGLVRSRAAEWNIDPGKIGVIGFSAGGHLAADVSTHWRQRAYPEADPADKTSCRPDFAVLLYPGHMLEHTTKAFELNPTVPVDAETPPTFIAQAEDDPVDPVDNSLVYYNALKKAGVAAELHLYAKGGHAFGVRSGEAPITRQWPGLLETWLVTIGVLPK
jgi:acetyl esterase/lipase